MIAFKGIKPIDFQPLPSMTETGLIGLATTGLGMGRLKKLDRSWLQRLLIGKPFWGLWGGRILATVIMSAIVAWTLQLFENGISEFVDTTIQNTLLVQLTELPYAPLECQQSNTNIDDKKNLVGCLSVIGIDDSDFRDVFQQRSPLNPDELRKLFDALRLAPPRVVAVDLDLSPASEGDWPAREHLFSSLLALSKVTQLVMVCPQGYSTPEPGPLDKKWVEKFGAEVQFASPNLGVDGLYYGSGPQLKTIGIVVAAAAANQAPQAPTSVDWNQACLSLRVSSDKKPKNHLIRPAHLSVANFSQAVTQPQAFIDRVVLIGGKWGINDQFYLRGQSEPFYGVNLHAWVTASELSKPKDLPVSAKLVLDVFIGMLAGAVFFLIWEKIAANRWHFGTRSFYYLLFFAVAFGLPILWVVAAAHLAKLGVVLGAAGMILSAAADSFLSAHDVLLDSPASEKPLLANKSLRDISVAQMIVKAWLRSAFAPVIAIVVSVLLFLILFNYGEHAWLGLICGVSIGVIFGRLDNLKLPNEGRGTGGNHDQAETTFDLVVRFSWLVLKAAALIWAITNPTAFDLTASAMLTGFLVGWCFSYYGPSKRVSLR